MLVSRWGELQGLAVVEQDDAVGSAVANGDDDIHLPIAVHIPKTETGGQTRVADAGQDIHCIFGMVLWVELDDRNHPMQVQGDEVIGMLRTISQPDVVVGLERARHAVLHVVLHPLPPVRHPRKQPPTHDHHDHPQAYPDHQGRPVKAAAVELGGRLWGKPRGGLAALAGLMLGQVIAPGAGMEASFRPGNRVAVLSGIRHGGSGACPVEARGALLFRLPGRVGT